MRVTCKVRRQGPGYRGLQQGPPEEARCASVARSNPPQSTEQLCRCKVRRQGPGVRAPKCACSSACLSACLRTFAVSREPMQVQAKGRTRGVRHQMQVQAKGRRRGEWDQEEASTEGSSRGKERREHRCDGAILALLSITVQRGVGWFQSLIKGWVPYSRGEAVIGVLRDGAKYPWAACTLSSKPHRGFTEVSPNEQCAGADAAPPHRTSLPISQLTFAAPAHRSAM